MDRYAPRGTPFAGVVSFFRVRLKKQKENRLLKFEFLFQNKFNKQSL